MVLRLVFGLPVRQTEGFVRSLLALMGARPSMCSRRAFASAHSPLPVAPTRANVDGRRLPAAATRRDLAHDDPAQDRLDHHPR